MTVKVWIDGDRGFHTYGEAPLRCTYGTSIRVYESSSAEGPHVWLLAQQDSAILKSGNAGEAHAHLNEEQARELVARVQAWLDEIPERWGR